MWMLLPHPTPLWHLLGYLTRLAVWSGIITPIKRLGLRLFCSSLARSLSPFESTLLDSSYIHFKLSSSDRHALSFSCCKSSQPESDIRALTRHEQASFYTRGPYVTEHDKAWIQDQILWKNFWETLQRIHVFKTGFIQMRLLFKDLQ